MNYEKKYNKLVEAIKVLQETNSSDEGIQNWVNDNVPELADSEDERIRKAIIEFFKLQDDNTTYSLVPKNDILAWLEKQGKQEPFDYENANIQQTDFAPKSAMEAIKEEKADNSNKIEPKDYSSIDPHYFKPINKVEPKFKVGDWISGYYTNYKVTAINSEGYEVEDTDGNKINILFENEKFHHLWTITDAKDGDVLTAHECLVLFKEIDWLNIRCYCTYHYLNHQAFYVDTLQNKTAFHPATKEQREQLKRAMADAGWEFDFDKKQLKKISNALEECEVEQIKHGKYYYCIKDYYSGGCKRASKGEVVQALKGMAMMALGVKANEYFIPVKCIIDNKSTWSEEDEDRLQSCLNILQAKGFTGVTETINTKWLKSLKERVQPKQEWSEEDEKYVKDLVDYFTEGLSLKHTEEDVANWLKSLRPQSHWKPSDRQMNALNAINVTGGIFCYLGQGQDLIDLYNDLKSLKERHTWKPSKGQLECLDYVIEKAEKD